MTTPPSPLDIFGSALAAWYDPSDSSTITKSNNLVSLLKDKSGNGNDLSASGTARPTYNATAIMGSSPGLVFNGSTTVLTSANTANIGTTAFSAFCLTEIDEALGSSNTLLGYTASGDAGPFGANSVMFVFVDQNGWLSTYQAGARAVASSIPVIGTPLEPHSLPGFMYIMGSVFDGANSTLYVNEDTSSSVAYSNSLNTPGSICLGGRPDFSNVWTGKVGETILVNRAVNATEMAAVFAWIKRHWSRVLIAEGDSIVGAGPLASEQSGYCFQYLPNANPSVFLNDIAIGGSDLNSNGNNTDLVVRAALTPSYCDGRIPTNKYDAKYIFYAALSNNIDSTQAYTDAFGAYLAARRTAGYDYIVTSTVISRTDIVGFDTVRAALNAVIKSRSWQQKYGISAVADFAADPIMGVDAAPSVNPSFFFDTVHPNPSGHARLEAIFRATINSIPLVFGPAVDTTLSNKSGRYFSRKDYAEWLAKIAGEDEEMRREYQRFIREAEKERNLTEIERADRDFTNAEEEYGKSESALFNGLTTTNHIKFSEAKEKMERARKERDHHYFMEVVKKAWADHNARKTK